MEPNFKPDGAEETAFSENVMDALCCFVYFAFAGRWNRVSFMGFHSGNGTCRNFSSDCSWCIHGRVGVAGWNESVVRSRSKSGVGKGCEE